MWKVKTQRICKHRYLSNKNADMFHDVSQLNIFNDEVVDEIYISHVLEHFSRRKILQILREYNRLLKPGGLLRIAVPDFDAVVDMYVKDKRNIYDLMGLMYGGQRDEYDYHKFIFTYDTIKNILECAGFSDVKRYETFEFLDDSEDDYSKSYLPHMDRNGKLMSLNVICKKISQPQENPNDDIKKLIKIN